MYSGIFEILLLNNTTGKIDLKLSKIRKHGTPINKYQYVIDVVSPKRTFYLCFLNVKIYEKWLAKLLELSKEIVSLTKWQRFFKFPFI